MPLLPLEIRSEYVQRLNNMRGQRVKDWYDGKLISVPKAYLAGRCVLHVHAAGWCGTYYPRPNFERLALYNREVPVLVGVGESFQLSEPVGIKTPVVVRLQRLDSCNVRRANPPQQTSWIVGLEILVGGLIESLWRRTDRELGKILRLRAVQVCKRIDQIVQRCPEIEDGFTKPDRPLRIDRRLRWQGDFGTMEAPFPVREYFNGVRMRLDDNLIWINSDLSLISAERVDVLPSPLDPEISIIQGWLHDVLCSEHERRGIRRQQSRRRQ